MTTLVENSVSSAAIIQWMEQAAVTFRGHKDELTQLDAAIGDADHGANMVRGFDAVQAKLPALRDQDIGAIFKAVAMVLISTVGGASGPLYGTFFLQAATSAAEKKALTHGELSAAFDAGLQGLINRGKAAVGDKTMLDALVPALAAFKHAGEESLGVALERAIAAAKKGADATVPLVAKKGRASYLGERSSGHMDPGARSSHLLLEALLPAVQPTS